MYMPGMLGLEFYGVADPGVANTERIVLRPTMIVNLGSYLLGLGVKQAGGGLVPLNNYVYWFPGEVVQPGSWVFVYTGTGETTRTTTLNTNEPALVLHWGGSQTLFNSPLIQPFVFQKGAFIIGEQIRG
jgi:hypothetical protein